MGNKKLGNLENFGNLGYIIPSFPIPDFSILAVRPNQKLEFENLGKTFPKFPRFPRFPNF